MMPYKIDQQHAMILPTDFVIAMLEIETTGKSHTRFSLQSKPIIG